jgi:cyanophycinase-like exopeptidase
MNGSQPSGLSIALLGSGEFEPWTEEVDRWLLDRATGDGTVLILPAASAPEGDAVFDRWAEMGLLHYTRLGVPAEVVSLKTGADAELPELSAKLATASMAYFSGGNPAYLAGVLRGSRFWRELLGAVRRGMAYTGCSAGIACLGELAVDSAAHARGEHDLWKPGLRMFPNLQFGPHWDALDKYVPGLQAMFIAAVPPDRGLLAIDEYTAVVGDGSDWRVVGSGGAQLRQNGKWRTFRWGQSFTEALDISLDAAPAQA